MFRSLRDGELGRASTTTRLRDAMTLWSMFQRIEGVRRSPVKVECRVDDMTTGEHAY